MMSLALKTEAGYDTQAERQMAFRSWKRRGNGFLPEPPEGTRPHRHLEFSPCWTSALRSWKGLSWWCLQLPCL